MSTIHYKYKGSMERHGEKKRATEILHIQCKSFEQLSLYNKLHVYLYMPTQTIAERSNGHLQAPD